VYLRKDAELSPCGRFRHWLDRAWDDARPRLAYVMLNPSTADALEDDQTIRRCATLADKFGYGSFRVVNLFDFRATLVVDLVRHGFQSSDGNAALVDATMREAADVVFAWGGLEKRWLAAHERARSVWESAARLLAPRAPLCFGRTKDGHPLHPSRLPNSVVLQPFSYPEKG
jgi:hypothetical protein